MELILIYLLFLKSIFYEHLCDDLLAKVADEICPGEGRKCVRKKVNRVEAFVAAEAEHAADQHEQAGEQGDARDHDAHQEVEAEALVDLVHQAANVHQHTQQQMRVTVAKHMKTKCTNNF